MLTHNFAVGIRKEVVLYFKMWRITSLSKVFLRLFVWLDLFLDLARELVAWELKGKERTSKWH